MLPQPKGRQFAGQSKSEVRAYRQVWHAGVASCDRAVRHCCRSVYGRSIPKDELTLLQINGFPCKHRWVRRAKYNFDTINFIYDVRRDVSSSICAKLKAIFYVDPIYIVWPFILPLGGP